MNRLRPSKPFLTFSQKLFLSVIALFIGFAACFLGYQYKREKEYKIGLLHAQLQNYNVRLHEKLDTLTYNKDQLKEIIVAQVPTGLRVTIIDPKGSVLFDTYQTNYKELESHLNREEIVQTLETGSGYDLRRTSETTGLPYFYSATLFNDFIVRSALPYNVNLINSLTADSYFVWFTLIITLALMFVLYTFTNKLGTAISQLRQFAMYADGEKGIEMNKNYVFPRNELGEISQYIIQMYKRLHKTKEALYIEREKLIAHLQSAHEGLGVFNRDKKEILVNNLFTQYSNVISDWNLQTTEDVFAITELQPIMDFINQMLKRPIENQEKRKAITIHKNGRIFLVECIIFQDYSFEISINDITQEEEQKRLKRQLTQNIAHELKTPVSSIQGYLETIVNTPDLPPQKMVQFLERCYAQSNRLSRLLRDISVLTRMDEVVNRVDMEQVDLSALFSNIIGEVSLQLEEKQIDVQNSLRPNMQILGNYSLLYSIFRNLMDNAIAYGGKSIRINCFREDDKFYYFSFADSGTGVPPEHLNRLFERFYRVDTGRSRKLGGTGLGLAIVKNAVLIHGGTISAKNNSSGGLEFIFTLAKA